jgi:hypothetical protein
MAMMVPGLISLAFYKRRPRLGQVLVGFVLTVVLSALLGYPFPGNILSHGGPVVGPALAAASGAILYLAVVAYFYYRYREKLPETPEGAPRATPP